MNYFLLSLLLVSLTQLHSSTPASSEIQNANECEDSDDSDSEQNENLRDQEKTLPDGILRIDNDLYPILNVRLLSSLYKKLEQNPRYIEATHPGHHQTALIFAMLKNTRKSQNDKIFSYKPQIDRLDWKDKTALHYAAQSHHRCSIDGIKILLARGAHPAIRCAPLVYPPSSCISPELRRTPRMIAEEKLKTAQADPNSSQKIISLFQEKITLLKAAEDKFNALLKKAMDAKRQREIEDSMDPWWVL